MVEEDIEEEDEFEEDGESEEELESIIEETDFDFSPTFRQAALEEIIPVIPVLQPRGGQNLEQGIADIPFVNNEEKDDQLIDYAIQGSKSNYDVGSDYQSNIGGTGEYGDQASPLNEDPGLTKFRSDQDMFAGQPGMPKQDEPNQGFQQKQYEFDKAKEVKDDRSRRFW